MAPVELAEGSALALAEPHPSQASPSPPRQVLHSTASNTQQIFFIDNIRRKIPTCSRLLQGLLPRMSLAAGLSFAGRHEKQRTSSCQTAVGKDEILLYEEKRCILCLISFLSHSFHFLLSLITCHTHLKTCKILSTHFIVFCQSSKSSLSMSKCIAN